LKLFDYESSGKGIAKEHKKKGLSLFFEIFMRKFWKICEVSFFYALFLSPIYITLTIPDAAGSGITKAVLFFGSLLFCMFMLGPATAGMTKVVRNFVLEKHSFIFTDFMKAFKGEFKKSVIVGLLDCLAIASVACGIKIYPQLKEVFGSFVYVCLTVNLMVGFIILMMNFYAFPMIVATDLSLKNVIKNSFALTCIALKKNMLTAIITLCIAFGMYYLILLKTAFFFLLPFFPAAVISFIILFRSYPVIQKYVIDPFYVANGGNNPEAPIETVTAETIFEDKGGSEKPIEKRKKRKGKTIS